MARYDFGGTLADFVVTPRRVGGLDVLGLSAATLTFWSAQSGGTRYTDLQLNGSATSSISVGTDGQVPTFQGPDTVTAMWADGGAGRTRIVAQGIPGPAGPGATNGDIADYLGAPGPTQTAADARYDRATGLDATGATDCGPALQALYDAGNRRVNLNPRGTYLIDSAVFLDSTDAGSKLVLNGHGATILLGPNLPTTAAYITDATTKWAFFPNTLRSALSGGVVTVTTATRATGTPGGMPRLLVNDVTVDGQGANRGFQFMNRCSTRMFGVVMRQARCLVSWFDYCDANILEQCHNRVSGVVADSWLLDQLANGDGLQLRSLKADGGLGIARVKTARGVTASGAVGGGYVFDSCRSVSYSGGHQEYDITTSPLNMLIKRSQVVIDASVMYPQKVSTGTAPGAIQIDDSAGNSFSDVVLRDVVESHFYRTGETDLISGPLVDILAADNATKLRSERTSSVTIAVGLAGVWPSTAGPLLRSADTGIQAAIDAPSTGSLLAAGDWELTKTQGGAWGFSNSVRGARAQSLTTAPTISQLNAAADTVTGTLVSGTTYEYAAAVLDAEGNYGPVTAASSLAAASNGAMRLLFDIDSAPCSLVVWRMAGTGVLATPDAYTVQPAGHYRLRLYDTGAQINGRPWVTTSVPVPNTVAASTHGREAIVMPLTGNLIFPLTTILKTSTSTYTSSTAYTTIMSGTVAPNSRYEFTAFVHYEADVTGKMKLGLTFPTGASASWTAVGPGFSGPAFVQTDDAIADGAGAGVKKVVLVSGRVIIGGTGGTFGIKAAQSVLNATSTIVSTTSRMTLQRTS